MKTIIHNSAHKNIRIPEHTYIIRHAGHSHGWQNINLIGPRLNKIFNHLIHCIVKQKTKFSETVPAGEVAGENVILFNHSNSNKMSTTKKVSSKMLVLFAAFLMAVGVGKAQGQTVKSADSKEVVSPGKEVKSTVLVPAKLAKAMDDSKGNGGKLVNNTKKVSNLQPYTYWYNAVKINPSLPNSNTNIRVFGSPISAPTGSECNTANSGDACAVQVEVSTMNYSFPNPIRLDSLSGMTAGSLAYHPEN